MREKCDIVEWVSNEEVEGMSKQFAVAVIGYTQREHY